MLDACQCSVRRWLVAVYLILNPHYFPVETAVLTKRDNKYLVLTKRDNKYLVLTKRDNKYLVLTKRDNKYLVLTKRANK